MVDFSGKNEKLLSFMSKQVFYLEPHLLLVGSSAGRMAVAPQAVLWDVRVPVAFHMVANSLWMAGAAAR